MKGVDPEEEKEEEKPAHLDLDEIVSDQKTPNTAAIAPEAPIMGIS